MQMIPNQNAINARVVGDLSSQLAKSLVSLGPVSLVMINIEDTAFSSIPEGIGLVGLIWEMSVPYAMLC